jgi:hypothetical protein
LIELRMQSGQRFRAKMFIETGAGDHRIQAFNFRVCLTRAADRLPFPKPAGYNATRSTSPGPSSALDVVRSI